MDMAVDADAPLNYATIQIMPSQNRYEAFICHDSKVYALTAGILDSLLPHLSEAKELYAKGCNAEFKLELPDTGVGGDWFTKSTLNRFLRIIGSSDLMHTMCTIQEEMAQLEEAKKFHLSLHEWQASSDASKNDLLRAMNLRIVALRSDLAAVFKEAAGTAYSSKEINDLAKFSRQFGATNLGDCISMFLEHNKNLETGSQNDHKAMVTNNSKNNELNRTDHSPKVSTIHSENEVKSAVSPTKVAQVERQSLTESDESSDSSDEDRNPAERSRSLIRSASPRRSASPMRRVQIGRTGSRRVPAVAIKSLTHFQVRERFSQGDGAAINSDEEESVHPGKRPDNNVSRISVQAAISLFESKQNDQPSDVEKRRSLASIPLGANKSVLRRWSAGMGKTSAPCRPEITGESVSTFDNLADGEVSNFVEVKQESDSMGHNLVGTTKVDVELDRSEIKAFDPIEPQAYHTVSQGEELNGKLATPSGWNQKKEAELNQMMMKMMETKFSILKKPQAIRNPSLPSEQRGGFYDNYKAKRDEKLRGENGQKKANKDAQFKVMQQMLDERKAEMASTKVNTIDTKRPTSKPRASQRNSPPKAKNPKKETPKPSTTRMILPKPSKLPDTRKSWPSSPSPRTVGTSPAKTPSAIPSTGTTTCRKPQPTPPFTQSEINKERYRVRQRNVKETLSNVKSLKSVNDKKQPTPIKSGRTISKKPVSPSGDKSDIVPPAKSKYSNKVTRKSSIVPLDSKPVQKGSGNVKSVVNKKETIFNTDDSQRSGRNLIEVQADEVVNASDLMIQHEERDFPSLVQCDVDLDSYPICGEKEKFDEVAVKSDDVLQYGASSSPEIQAEEESIMAKAWLEIEEDHNMPPSSNDTSQIASSEITELAKMPGPRVRHSLSQMLQEEISEPETMEWGNAEIPPSMFYQKDGPKGLKRLLKFARKSKGDGSMTSWSSPSVASEGEDSYDESKAFGKRNADNLLRKATLQAKNRGHLRDSFDRNSGARDRNSGTSGAQNFTHGIQESHSAGEISTTKGTKSFFSLSAFRGK